MTVLDEAPVVVEASESSPRTERSRWARLGAELRLARRQALREKGASALVVALVALPLIAISAGLVIWDSHQPTLAHEVTVELGQAQSRIEIVSGPDPTLQQGAADPWWWEVSRDPETGVPVNAVQPFRDDPLTLLPAGTATIEIGTGTITAQTPGGIGAFTAVIGDAWNPTLAGRYEFLSGRAPSGLGEAMVSPGALTRLGAAVGDRIELTEPAASFTISGVLKIASEPDSAPTVFLPSTRATDTAAEYRAWFAPDWEPTASELAPLNREGVIVFARDLMLSREGGRSIDPGSLWAVAAVTAIVGTFTAYLVVLLAGAAFSVSARRQQRSLAVAASVGAPAGSLRRMVLLQGTVLGLVGGVIGAAIGIAAAYPVLVLLDDGRAASFWGFHVPWWGIVGVILFAVAVGTASAFAPARTATKRDVLQALRGARLPVQLRTKRPLWGSLLIATGLAATVTAGLGLAALNAAETIDYNDPMRSLAVAGIIGGPLLFQLGVILAGHWLLTLIARVFSRFGLAARLAARDAAAHPGRIVPAFGAIAACVFIAAFALSAVSVSLASAARNYVWTAPKDSAYVSVWGSGTTAEAEEVEDAAVQAIASTEPSSVAIVRGEPVSYEVVDGVPLDDRLETVFRAERFGAASCFDPATVGICLTDYGSLIGYGQPLRVIAEDELPTALGTAVPDAALRVFRDGGALVLPAPRWSAGTPIADGHVTLREWDGEVLELGGGDMSDDAPVIASIPGDTAGEIAPLRVERLPAAEVSIPQLLPWEIVISPEAAERLGMRTAVVTVIGAYDAAPTQQIIDKLALLASGPWKNGGFTAGVERGPGDAGPWLLLILAAAGALVLGAGSVALGLARVERRPDDATLTAVGATRRLRRGIAFWQSLVIVGLGALSGTIAGVIPMIGMTLALDDLRIADTPWLWLAGLALGIPLVIAVASWLVPPRHPDLTRRTAIA